MFRIYREKTKAQETAYILKRKPEPPYRLDSYKEFEVVSLDDVWDEVTKTADQNTRQKNTKQDKRIGWRTVRIFVSSTFKDFHTERDVLVKKVFPDLREWCAERKLHLVECDLRWGVPPKTESSKTIEICLEEIDRCYVDNEKPFFINMTSERTGWVPIQNEIPDTLAKEYNWIYGLSVTEMEIMHGAYRGSNPNSLFMIRSMEQVDDTIKAKFKDGNDKPEAHAKLAILKSMIQKRFSNDQVVKYTCTPKEELEQAAAKHQPEEITLELDESFVPKVLEFFKKRIDEQYPMQTEEMNTFELKQHKKTEQHRAFYEMKAESVFGREEIVEKVVEMINAKDSNTGDTASKFMLLVGEAGIGKSSIMAKIASETAKRKDDAVVFYHFVGAVPESTEVFILLNRLLFELGEKEEDMPSGVQEAVQKCAACLSENTVKTKPIVILIDALNQLDDDPEALHMNWIPHKLASNVRIVCSLKPGTPQHVNLMDRMQKPREIMVDPLKPESKRIIVQKYFLKFNKRLNEEQMKAILKKRSSDNPLWLSIACEELRVFGDFKAMTSKIASISETVTELLIQVFERFENDDKENRAVLVATLRFLEVSARGLLESELLEILTNDSVYKGTLEKDKSGKKLHLPYSVWVSVYRALRIFLRPFGDRGEGRLDFYHRSLSAAVKKRYFKEDAPEISMENRKWSHLQLAEYFEKSSRKYRNIEEYPYQAMSLDDKSMMYQFLDDWETFEFLYNPDQSIRLIKYWQWLDHGDDEDKKGRMTDCYRSKIEALRNQSETTLEYLTMKTYEVANLFVQAGYYDDAISVIDDVTKLTLSEEMQTDFDILCCTALEKKVASTARAKPEQVPDVERNISLCSKVIKYFDSFEDETKDIKVREYFKAFRIYKKIQRKKGILYVRQANAHDCFIWRMWRDPDQTKIENANTRGKAAAQEALRLFEEIGDVGRQAEARLRKAMFLWHDKKFEQEIEELDEARKLSIQAHGELHDMTYKIYRTMGRVYERLETWEPSFHHYHKALKICQEIYGDQHPITRVTLGTMSEPELMEVAQKLNITDIPFVERE